ncbi:MAG: hypothetical protein ACTH4Y_11600 [Microbacterium gubbeenense]|uniref:hypothetical protein n=1 Tax=Microbacterium gubbeenense TaxID=159896 RepID=UPI003F962A54
MTAASFNAYIEETAPHIVTASHYSLAPDVYGLDDGYAWAFATVSRTEALANADSATDANDPATGLPAANASTYNARHHLADGGEWPYYIAAKPSPAVSRADGYTAATPTARRNDPLPDENGDPIPYPGDVTRDEGDTINDALREGRILETYCEGDLTAYIFETKDERDEAADRWQEAASDVAARIIEDHGGATPSEQLAEAVLDEVTGGHGSADSLPVDELTDLITEILDDRYVGEWASEADYAESFFEDTTPPETLGMMGHHNHRSQYDDSAGLWSYIDWDRYASDMQLTTYPAAGGNVHIFTL